MLGTNDLWIYGIQNGQTIGNNQMAQATRLVRSLAVATLNPAPPAVLTAAVTNSFHNNYN